MAILKCPAGHFYDGNKYATCPYCEKNSQGMDRSASYTQEDKIREDVTIAMPKIQPSDRDVTIGMYGSIPKDDEKTIGIYSKNSGRTGVAGWLVCTEGKERGRDYRLYGGYNWIGRDYRMDVCVVEDEGISRYRHAAIVYDKRSGVYFLLPGNGISTFLNGGMIMEAAELKRRDTIRIGSSTFVFVPFCEEGFTWEQGKD